MKSRRSAVPVNAGKLSFRTKRPRGAARMKEFGYRRVEVWFDKAEYALVQEDAIALGKPLATYVREEASRGAANRISARRKQ